MRSHLVPKQTVTKRGVLTTVHVNPDQEAGNSKSQQRSIRATSKAPTSLVQNKPMLIIAGSRLTFPALPTKGQAPTLNGEWTGDTLQHSHIKRGDIELYAVAPPGYSGAYCYQCGSFYREVDINEAKTVCDVCGCVDYGSQLATGIRAEDVELYDDSALKERVWYHATTRANWSTDITEEEASAQPLVHLGSREAAETRMKALVKEQVLNDQYRGTKSEPYTFYLYAVRIKDDASVAPEVIADYDTDVPESAQEILGKEESQRLLAELNGTEYEPDEFYEMFELFGVTRYVNSYEGHGSVSLIAHPSSFEVVERTVLN